MLLAAGCSRHDESARILEESRLKEQALKEQLSSAKEELRLQETRFRESKLAEFAELESKTKADFEKTREAHGSLKGEVDATLQQIKDAEP